MKRYLIHIMALSLLLLSATSCEKKAHNNSQNDESMSTLRSISSSPFSADSAYLHIKQQVDFGPRVPNSEAHKATSNYIKSQLTTYGIPVFTQEAMLKAYDGTMLEATNIIGTYKPEAKKRIMLFAHWDTRPFADHDPSPLLQKQPILGADDGASGPGVMLEVARLLSEVGLDNIGVDLMFFDAEDYGLPSWVTDYTTSSEETWALGTQYWTKNLHTADYKPLFGILLDMVGAEGAIFQREYFSQEAAGNYVTKIWLTAKELGHDNYFINKMGGAITDDHYFVIRNLRIPCVDIINYDNNFASHWHTHNDNLDVISKETLQAVGETVWQVLCDFDQGDIE